MTDYILPRTESGEVDYYELKQIIQENGIDDDLLMAIVNNARAEERERCALKVEEVGPMEGSVALVTKGFSDAIRNPGDSHE